MNRSIEAVTNIFTNLTMFLVAQMIFVHQDFRTIHLLFQNPLSEFSNKISQIASNSLKPATITVLGRINVNKSQIAGPLLNIVVLDHSNVAINTVKGNIFQGDVTIILQNPINDGKDMAFRWMNLSAKVMILTKSHLIFLNSFENGKITEIDLASFNPIRT